MNFHQVYKFHLIKQLVLKWHWFTMDILMKNNDFYLKQQFDINKQKTFSFLKFCLSFRCKVKSMKIEKQVALE